MGADCAHVVVEVMTDEQLAAIEQRVQAATPGPWRVEQKDGDRYLYDTSDTAMMCDMQYYPWAPDEEGDWQFIAHAREDVPALLAEVRRLQALCVAEKVNPYLDEEARARIEALERRGDANGIYE